MITKLVIDPEALDQDVGRDALIRFQHLHYCIAEYGLLTVLNPADGRELEAALRKQVEACGYDFWTHLLKAMSGKGDSLLRMKPPLMEGVSQLRQAGDLRTLSSCADVLVVNRDSPGVSGLSETQYRELVERQGRTHGYGALEIAIPDAVSLTDAIKRTIRMRGESEIPKGTHKQDIWDQRFAPFARLSTEVNISDRYLFARLAGRPQAQRGRADHVVWLLENLYRTLPKSAVVNLYAYSGEKVQSGARNRPREPYRIRDISEVVRRARHNLANGRLHLYMSDATDHDRHIRFSRGHALKPDGGFDQFAFDRDGKLSKGVSMKYVNGAALDSMSEKEELARNGAKHLVLKSKKRGFEPYDPTTDAR